jgi:hypothetical protein
MEIRNGKIIMGMFDSIICKAPLPLPEDIGELKDLKIIWDEEVFQTKDLENLLDSYTIHKDGTLTFEEHDKEWVEYSSEERKKHFTGGYLKVKRQWTTKKTYHGEILFYTDYFCKTKDYWIEFKATFTDSKLSNIELHKFEETDNSERRRLKLVHDNQLKIYRERQKKLWYKFYKYLWLKPIRFIFRRLYRISTSLPHLILKIERKILPF